MEGKRLYQDLTTSSWQTASLDQSGWLQSLWSEENIMFPFYGKCKNNEINDFLGDCDFQY